MQASLAKKLEYAVLQLVCRDRSRATQQSSIGEWRHLLSEGVQPFEDAELVSAFKRLWRRGTLRLTKPSATAYHGREYSGNALDDELFFFKGPFNATITDEGRSEWDSTAPVKSSLFISHIGEEKRVALRLQSLVQIAFGSAFPVFASSDPSSLGGGEEWYHHILANLSTANVVLVLLSPDSVDRPWINFEAGFGRGQHSHVIPIAYRGLSFDALEYPLKGLQGYYLPALSDILDEIARRMNVKRQDVDIANAWDEINDLQVELPAKKLALELRERLKHPNWECRFELVNNGNRDVEPLEVIVRVPSNLLTSPFRPAIDKAILDVQNEDIDGVAHTTITYRNHREPMTPNRFSNPERLVKCLAPGMRSELQHLLFDVRHPLSERDRLNPIRYRVIAKNLQAVDRLIVLKDRFVLAKF